MKGWFAMKNEMIQENGAENKIRTFFRKNKRKILIISTGIGAICLAFLGTKYIIWSDIKSRNDLSESFQCNGDVENTVETLKSISEIDDDFKPHEYRYLVEFKAFKTGEWYTKTRTDHLNSACSVASCNSYGRAYRVTDTVEDVVIREEGEDESMAACNGYPNGYPW